MIFILFNIYNFQELNLTFFHGIICSNQSNYARIMEKHRGSFLTNLQLQGKILSRYKIILSIFIQAPFMNE